MPSLGLKPGLPDRQWLAGRLPKLENVKSRGQISVTRRKGFQHALVPGFPSQREFQHIFPLPSFCRKGDHFPLPPLLKPSAVAVSKLNQTFITLTFQVQFKQSVRMQMIL